jgi:alpha-galactosidase
MPIAYGADLTGRWVASTQIPDGQKRETVIALKAEGDRLSGYMSSPQGDTAISEGRVNGDEISFVIVREMGGQERKIQYTGKITADGLLMKMPGFGDRPSRELLARRVSTDPPKPLPPPAPKIALPPMQDVKPNGLARTPPMGWNSWNKFRGNVSDQVVREIANAMVKNGMQAAGYVYVNIDDTWEGSRDAQGAIRSNEKFPNMKALADYVHGKGLKLGIYSSPGPKTCAQFEGSFQHEEQDAKTFAAWGIDYLKYDWCSAGRVYQSSSMPAAYAKMGQALLDSGRPIVYSLCQYGAQNVGEWGARAGGNLWRTTGDIRDTWRSMSDLGFEKQIGLEKYAGPGHWNDPDMLEIGNGGMSETEYRTHMSLWSLLAAPLLAGNDLREVSPGILQILLNKEVIAVDQDKLGKQGVRVSKDGDLEVWARPLADGSHAVCMFNRGDATAKVTTRWSDIGVKGSHKVSDLWAHADRGKFSDAYAAEVPSHGVVMVRVH